MKKLILFSLPILLLIIGCSENNLTDPIDITDTELKAKIVGTWFNDYVTINYDADGNFHQSVNYIPPDSVLPGAEIIKGTYDIEDGILMYTITEWNINYTSSNNGFGDFINEIPVNIIGMVETGSDLNNEIYVSHSIPDVKILIENDFLYFYPLDILTRTDNNTNDIWGEWNTFRWAIGYDTNTQNNLLGKLELRFIFNQDSMTVTHGIKFLADPNAEFYFETEPIVYNPPDLSWGIYNKSNYTIEFKDGKMNMFYNLGRTPIPLRKEK